MTNHNRQQNNLIIINIIYQTLDRDFPKVLESFQYLAQIGFEFLGGGSPFRFEVA